MSDTDTVTTDKPERDAHKTTFDLEDVTGNPGHRNLNPNEAWSMNPRLPLGDQSVPSINEPPGRERGEPPKAEAAQAQEYPPHMLPLSINEPPGSEVIPPVEPPPVEPPPPEPEPEPEPAP